MLLKISLAVGLVLLVTAPWFLSRSRSRSGDAGLGSDGATRFGDIGDHSDHHAGADGGHSDGGGSH
jgi:hypothetical protein